MTTSSLDNIARSTITALELASTVSAPTAGPRVHVGKPEARLPGHIVAPHLHYSTRYDGCRTDEQRRSVISDALTELREIRYSRRPTVDCQTLEGRLTVGRDPRPVSLLAYIYGYSERHIHRLRAEARKRAA